MKWDLQNQYIEASQIARSLTREEKSQDIQIAKKIFFPKKLSVQNIVIAQDSIMGSRYCRRPIF